MRPSPAALALAAALPFLAAAQEQSADLAVAAASVAVTGYSYLCLDANNATDLCLGISPGSNDPVWNPNQIYWAQVKSESKTQYKQTDYKKTRWDFNYTAKTLSLSYFPLCLARAPHSYQVGLFPCSNVTQQAVFNQTGLNGLWNLSPFSPKLPPNQAGIVQLSGSNKKQCLTVMKCVSGALGFCDPNSQVPAANPVTGAPDQLNSGAYLRMYDCYDQPNSKIPGLKTVQVWRERSDCINGCPPWLQYNGVCDPACNVKQCNYDNGDCITKAPTPPTTLTPTILPTHKGETQSPTVPTLPHTVAPTYACPAFNFINACPKFKQKTCSTNKHVAKNCVWCPSLGLCQARSSNPGLCKDPNVYKYCEPFCPSAWSVSACPGAHSARSCHGSPKKPNACAWCGSQCIAGPYTQACTDPTFYSQCQPPTPPAPFCPSQSQYRLCLASTTSTSCTARGYCTWCPAGNGVPANCRPMGSGVCKAPSVLSFFQNCPGFGTFSPTTPTTLTTHVPTTHVPTTHVPTTHVPTTHVPTTHVPSLT